MKIILLATTFLTILFYSCGVSQTDNNELRAENERLKDELNECLTGAEKIIESNISPKETIE